jgi:single-stranded DNA-binding protein
VKEINRVILTGEVVADAVFGYTARGTGVATFTLAFVTEQHGGGRQKGRIDVICMGDAAAGCAAIARRAEWVKVEGSLQQRNWKTPEGFQKSKTEIMARAVEHFKADAGQASQ